MVCNKAAEDAPKVMFTTGDCSSTMIGASTLPPLRGFSSKRTYCMLSEHHEQAGEDMFTIDDSPNHVGKKRRLTATQVRSLEMSFEMENKLEAGRKQQLANQLGLQPRQISVWFQNRRARWKAKQLEHDFNVLKHEYDAVVIERERLWAEVVKLDAKLQASGRHGERKTVTDCAGKRYLDDTGDDYAKEREEKPDSSNVSQQFSIQDSPIRECIRLEEKNDPVSADCSNIMGEGKLATVGKGIERKCVGSEIVRANLEGIAACLSSSSQDSYGDMENVNKSVKLDEGLLFHEGAYTSLLYVDEHELPWLWLS